MEISTGAVVYYSHLDVASITAINALITFRGSLLVPRILIVAVLPDGFFL